MSFCFIYHVKISFLNTNFNNISLGFGKNYVTKSPKKSFEGPVTDVFEKSVDTKPEKNKRVSDEKKTDIDIVKPWAKRLSSDVEMAYKIFKAKMENTFTPVCNYDSKKYDWLPEEECKGKLILNKKSITSIIEKMLSGGKRTEKEARAEIKDAIRGRVVLTHGSQEEGDKVCNEIIKAVEKGTLEIKHIKNYTTDDNMQYVSSKMINKLKKAVKDASGGVPCEYTEKAKSTGYNAVHIIFKIDNEFDGELQIMGKNVENLKDVEDVFYKLSGNKHVAKQYKDIEKKYKSLASKSQNKLEENLNSYVRDAYLYERKKELGILKDLYHGKFLPLNTEKYNLPEEFDFNNIAKIKKSAQ